MRVNPGAGIGQVLFMAELPHDIAEPLRPAVIFQRRIALAVIVQRLVPILGILVRHAVIRRGLAFQDRRQNLTVVRAGLARFPATGFEAVAGHPKHFVGGDRQPFGCRVLTHPDRADKG